jgi:ubiquinone biosynthesis protein UbiJ
MSDPTSDFFADLAARGQVPMLRSTTGTLRFDLEDGGRMEHWYVTIKRGAVDVTHGEDDADCEVRASKELFDRLASGTANAMAAALRGLVLAVGDLSLVISFQRLFPGPPADSHREQAGYARRAT